jgi:hypothetical protein
VCVLHKLKCNTSVLTPSPGFLFGSGWRLAQLGEWNHGAGQKHSERLWFVSFNPWPPSGSRDRESQCTSMGVPVMWPGMWRSKDARKRNGPKIAKAFSWMSVTKLRCCRAQL